MCQIRIDGFLKRIVSRAVNELNVQRTVREPFGGKFVYVRSISLTKNTNKKFRSITLTNEHEQRSRSFDCVRERSVICSFVFVRLCPFVFGFLCLFF
ncbi:hypothetical protein HanRHA438_Chr15g0690941 [Helianthus annuus]|nr:hypothetical protein HanRHA438_Chr15g0690941 [Helianthus annuus]